MSQMGKTVYIAKDGEVVFQMSGLSHLSCSIPMSPLLNISPRSSFWAWDSKSFKPFAKKAIGSTILSIVYVIVHEFDCQTMTNN